MSFFHSTLVGHFDPETLTAWQRNIARPLEIHKARAMLDEFPDYVSDNIEFHDGYVQCWWASPQIDQIVSQAVHDYAYRLAKALDCVAAEMPNGLIEYPENAKQRQADAWARRLKENLSTEREPLPTLIFNPTQPVPCPYCGNQLRTTKSRQCRYCKMDWHDPESIHRR